MPAKNTKQEPPRSRLARLVRLVFRPWPLMLAAIAAAGWFLAPTIRRALPPIDQRDEYRVSIGDIEVRDLPRWIPEDFVEEAVRRAGLPEEMSLLDDRLVEEIAGAFRLDPWVRDVVQVEKSFPARVVATLEFREPVAMVQVRGGMYPVDAHGVLLPPEDFSPADTHRFPAIAGVTSTPQGPAGASWGDPVVIGAARIAAALLPEWRGMGLVAIRAISPGGKSDEITFELVAPGGSRIVWGRAPGSDHPGELPPEQKLGRLKEYRERFGDFDGPHGPYEIDIRHWQEISRRPLAEGRAGERR